MKIVSKKYFYNQKKNYKQSQKEFDSRSIANSPKKKKENTFVADKDFVKKLNHLRQKKIFPSVVAVKESHCPACSMSFVPQIFQMILSESHSSCPHCSRILVVDDAYLQEQKEKKK